MWTHAETNGNNELLLKALRLFIEDKIDPEALKIMLRDVFEIKPQEINTSESIPLQSDSNVMAKSERPHVTLYKEDVNAPYTRRW